MLEGRDRQAVRLLNDQHMPITALIAVFKCPVHLPKAGLRIGLWPFQRRDGVYDGLSNVRSFQSLALVSAVFHSQHIGLNHNDRRVFSAQAGDQIPAQSAFACPGLAHDGQETVMSRSLIHGLTDVANIRADIHVFCALQILERVSENTESTFSVWQ